MNKNVVAIIEIKLKKIRLNQNKFERPKVLVETAGERGDKKSYETSNR